MKTYVYIFLILFVVTSLKAQQKIDTIYANEHKNVALFFPKPVRQGITGASNFVFTYNREKEQYFGLLQAQPGTESNLLAVTNDGEVYSYILRYKKELPKLNYFVHSKESIGNEIPKIIKVKPKIVALSKAKIRSIFFEKFSKYLLRLKPENIKTKRRKRLKLRLQQMVYQGSEVYLVMELTNNSEIDFEFDYLDVHIISGNKKRKASYQKIQQEVIYNYRSPSVVKSKASKRFVLVLPKFVLGDNEKLGMELKERNGNRKLLLKTTL